MAVKCAHNQPGCICVKCYRWSGDTKCSADAASNRKYEGGDGLCQWCGKYADEIKEQFLQEQLRQGTQTYQLPPPSGLNPAPKTQPRPPPRPPPAPPPGPHLAPPPPRSTTWTPPGLDTEPVWARQFKLSVDQLQMQIAQIKSQVDKIERIHDHSEVEQGQDEQGQIQGQDEQGQDERVSKARWNKARLNKVQARVKSLL